MSDAGLLAEALATLAVLIRAYLGWIILAIAILTIGLLGLVAALNTAYDHLRSTWKDTTP